jgi:hypothetical protein
MTWFLNLHSLQIGSKRPIRVILKSEFPAPQGISKIFNVHQATTRKQAVQIAKDISELDGSITFIFLDGEQWIRYLLRTGIRCRVLFMRPYVSAFNVKAFLKFPLKIFALVCLNFSKDLEISFLKIPHHNPIFWKSRWVSDNLTTSDVHGFEKSQAANSKQFTVLVPGFISERKSPDFVLKIAMELEVRFPGIFHFYFFGSVDQHTKNLMDTSSLINVSYQDKYFSRSDYLDMIRSADLVLLIYKNRSASGIIMESLALDKKVLIHGSYLWMKLRDLSQDSLIFLPKTNKRILTQFENLISKKQLVVTNTSEPKYEFLDKNDPSGLIYFISKPK